MKFLLIFGLFWMAIISVFNFLLISGAVRQTRAESWPTVEGVIIHSEVESIRSSDGTSYKPNIHFEYRVAGTTYIGDEYRFGIWSTSDRRGPRRIVAEFPVNSVVPVYYDPNDPSRAILVPGLGSTDYFLTIFLIPFNVVGLGILLVVADDFRIRLLKLPAGGVRIRERPNLIFVRLPRLPPIMAGAITAGAVSFVSVFVLAFGFGMDAGLVPLVTTLIIIIGSGAAVTLWRSYRIGSGLKDLVIDYENNVLSLPLSFDRETEIIVPFDRISAIQVDEVVQVSEKGNRSTTFAVTVHWQDDDGEKKEDKLTEWMSRDRANALASWLVERVPYPGNSEGSRYPRGTTFSPAG